MWHLELTVFGALYILYYGVTEFAVSAKSVESAENAISTNNTNVFLKPSNIYVPIPISDYYESGNG